MIVDAHTHICSPEVRNDRSRYLIRNETAFSAIYSDPKAKLAGAADLVRAMDEDGVDAAVSFGFPWAGRDTARAQNDYVREAMDRFPGRIVGLACFDPLQPWAEAEAVRALDSGLKGLGELAVYGAGFGRDAVGRLSALAALSRERDVPMLVHVNEPIGHKYPGKAPLTLETIHDLVLACPQTRLVLAHWGGGLFFYNSLKREVPDSLKGVYFDTAASPFLYRPIVYRLAADAVGPEKILFGSDYPLIRPRRYFKEMEEAGLDPETIGIIKGRAAEKAFALNG